MTTVLIIEMTGTALKSTFMPEVQTFMKVNKFRELYFDPSKGSCVFILDSSTSISTLINKLKKDCASYEDNKAGITIYAGSISIQSK